MVKPSPPIARRHVPRSPPPVVMAVRGDTDPRASTPRTRWGPSPQAIRGYRRQPAAHRHRRPGRAARPGCTGHQPGDPARRGRNETRVLDQRAAQLDTGHQPPTHRLGRKVRILPHALAQAGQQIPAHLVRMIGQVGLGLARGADGFAQPVVGGPLQRDRVGGGVGRCGAPRLDRA